MSVPAPHFLLRARTDRKDEIGRWCFTLESSDGSHSVEVEDAEPDTRGDRLELLALVRGLEALPQPAKVTVVESSRYVHRVLDNGLDEWRANDWRWERHGEMVPVKNADLWRRVDRALQFHELKCQPRTPKASHRTRSQSHRDPKGCSRTPLGVLSRRSSDCRQGVRRSNPPGTEPRPTRPNSLAHKVLVVATRVRRRLAKNYRRCHDAVQSFVAECDSFPGDN